MTEVHQFKEWNSVSLDKRVQGTLQAGVVTPQGSSCPFLLSERPCIFTFLDLLSLLPSSLPVLPR